MFVASVPYDTGYENELVATCLDHYRYTKDLLAFNARLVSIAVLDVKVRKRKRRP
jgi:hypothetical protein